MTIYSVPPSEAADIPSHIGSVEEYLCPVSRQLMTGEMFDVASELARKIEATTMLLMCADTGEKIALRHDNLTTIIDGLSNDARLLCAVLDGSGALQ